LEYAKENLAKNFIQLSKSQVGASIFFVKKKDYVGVERVASRKHWAYGYY